MVNLFEEVWDILVCPNCRSHLHSERANFECESCEARYPVSDEGTPLLFLPNAGWTNRQDVTETVKGFYEVNPFPNYDDMDSREHGLG